MVVVLFILSIQSQFIPQATPCGVEREGPVPSWPMSDTGFLGSGASRGIRGLQNVCHERGL